VKLHDPQYKAEILRRLKTLRPDARGVADVRDGNLWPVASICYRLPATTYQLSSLGFVRFVGCVRRRGRRFEQLSYTRGDGGFRFRLGSPVAELFAFNPLLILQAVFVSASCHTLLLIM
jgi:hypothetical protein